MLECSAYRDMFELLLALEYDGAATLPDGAVLPPLLISQLERSIGRALGRLMPHTPLFVMLSTVDTPQRQLHLRGVVLTTHKADGWRLVGQLTPELRMTYTDPLLDGVKADMLVLNRRPDRDAPALCRLLQQYDQLHDAVSQQLHRQLSDNGRQAQLLGLQYYAFNARTTLQATHEMIENARYHKRYLVDTAPDTWMAQYTDLLTTFVQRNGRERSHGTSPTQTAMRNVMKRVAAVLLTGAQHALQGQPFYADLGLAEWDAGQPTPPEDGREYEQARWAWWNRR